MTPTGDRIRCLKYATLNKRVPTLVAKTVLVTFLVGDGPLGYDEFGNRIFSIANQEIKIFYFLCNEFCNYQIKLLICAEKFMQTKSILIN